jgi:hypothetical protein
MAIESKIQKPTQSNRKGEVAEGLPGVAKERGMCEEKHQTTWETQLVPRSREVSEVLPNLGTVSNGFTVGFTVDHGKPHVIAIIAGSRQNTVAANEGHRS